MKSTVLVLAFLFVILTSESRGQTVVNQKTDSSGTATVYWQTIDMFDLSQKNIEVINDGSVNLLLAFTKTDTAATRTRYQSTIKPAEVFASWSTTNRYFYLKSASSTCAYRIRNF